MLNNSQPPSRNGGSGNIPPRKPPEDNNGDLSDFGLPPNWQPGHVPTMSELEAAARQRLNLTRRRIEQSQRPVSHALLENAFDTIRISSEFPDLLPDVIDFALSLSDVMRGAARNDLWLGIMMCLQFVVIQHAEDKTTQSQLLAQTFTEIGRLRNQKSNHEGAYIALNLAVSYGLNNPDKNVWLIAQTECLRATFAKRSLRDAEAEGLALLTMAHSAKDKYVAMMVHRTLAIIYLHHGLYEKTFTHGQQCLLIANRLGNLEYMLTGIANMVSFALHYKHTRNYANQLITVFEQHDSIAFDLWTQALYYGQLAPFLYCQGSPQAAEVVYRIGIPLYERLENNLDLAKMLHGLGMCLTRLAKYDEAATVYRRARVLYKKSDHEAGRFLMQYCLGWNALKRNNFQQAVKRLEKAKAYGLKYPNNMEIQNDLRNLEDDLDKARSLLA